MYFWIEFGLSALSVALAYAWPELGASWFQRAEQLLDRLAQKRRLSVLVVGLTALAVRAALLPVLPIPVPAGDDEFSYLLMADTFAHGRLTNPTHPMWIHFETMHVMWQPTYTGIFYPAQGLIMGLGQAVLGHPFWGVWLSMGLMCAAICWMLQGWLPPGWALLGGFLAVIRLGTFSCWANSYWGGAVAATGGALVLGALPRIRHSLRLRDGLLLGLGFAVLANSRPYEGLFLGLPVADALGVWAFGKNRPPLGIVAKRLLAPFLLIMVLTGLGMGYYFWRTTGGPFRPTYLVYERSHNPAPYFPWQSMGPPPVYHHAVMRGFYDDYTVRHYLESRSVKGIVDSELVELTRFWDFYLGPTFSLPLLLALATLPYGFSWRDVSANTRFLSVVCGVVTVGSMAPIKATWFLPHYAAAITCAILALVLLAMRRIASQAGRSRPAGSFVARAIPVLCLVMLLLRAGAKPLHLPYSWPAGALSWCAPAPTNLERAKTLDQLRRYPGGQLAIVRYGPQHDAWYHEWVYNEADIDGAKVVWARDMGPAGNKELVDYFRDRHVWLVEADETPPRVVPYSASI